MYVFGISLLLGLAVMVVAGIGERYILKVAEFRAAVLVILGIAAAWATWFDLWVQWGITTRAGWLSTTLTGAMLGGIAYAWYAILGLFSGMSRKVTDEAANLEQTQGLRAA